MTAIKKDGALRLSTTGINPDTLVQQTVSAFGGDFITPKGLRERLDRLSTRLSEDLRRRRR